jgi:uncharacterized membrane protein
MAEIPPAPSQVPGRRPELSGARLHGHAVALSLGVGYALMVLLHRPPIRAMLSGALLPSELRQRLLITTIGCSLAVAAGLWLLHRIATRRDETASLSRIVTTLWPLSLLPLLPYVFNTELWSGSPLLLYTVTTAVCCYCAWLATVPDGLARLCALLDRRGVQPALLLTMIAAYTVYVSHHTILNHYSLGTSAYDLGIHENTLWNTIHGRFFESSLEGGSHLGVHSSFVLLLLVPIYALFPATETLLVAQAGVLALAAWPLYLAARSVLGNGRLALLVAALWLAHPAVAGANFYDFHAIVFAPLFLFAAVWLWKAGRWRPFWLSIALLLSVKEDMSLVVLLLGVVMALSGERRRGAILAGVGAAAYLLLQHLVIPHFAGGAHSYTWYYTGMIPPGEGPSGLIRTIVLNPLFTLKFALSPPRLLYLFQLFAPLAFLPFLRARGIVLISYGLASSILASRAPLHQLGFQYALVVLAPAFVGLLVVLEDRPPALVKRALAAAAMLAVVTCFHYGMIWPRHDFSGGFHLIDFSYTDEERERYAELRECIRMIPADASVLASESLVPHVARRRVVETTRYAEGRRRQYDAVLVHNDGTLKRLESSAVLNRLRGFEQVHTGPHFVLMTKPE